MEILIVPIFVRAEFHNETSKASLGGTTIRIPRGLIRKGKCPGKMQTVLDDWSIAFLCAGKEEEHI